MNANRATELVEEAIEGAIGAFAARHSFIRERGKWRRSSADTTLGIDLQRSRFGPQFYINLGLSLNALSLPPGRRRPNWHISLRLNELAPDEDSHIIKLLDSDASLSDTVRRVELESLLERWASPFVEAADTLRGVRGLVASGVLDTAAVVPEAREFIRERGG
jgi:hypothetical protein